MDKPWSHLYNFNENLTYQIIIFLNSYNWDYLQKHQEWENICKTPSNLEELLIPFSEEEKKHKSKIYEELQHESNDNNMDVKEKLELEANIITARMGGNFQRGT